MLENSKARLVLSFILAFALWFYVVGQLDPVTKKTYREISITLANEQTLSDSGLAVVDSSDDTLRVTVSGKRNAVSRLSKADIVATVDLTNAAEGVNKLPIDLKIPENIEIDNQSLNEITVNVEERVTEERNVRVVYLGEYPEELEPTTIKVDPETVELSGARSLVEKVAYVRAEINAGENAEELYSSTSMLTPVMTDGTSVSSIGMSASQCKITSIMYKSRTVKLVVPVKDKSDDGLTRSTSCQETITIKGPEADLKAVDQIKARKVDVTDVTEDTEVTIAPVLPDGIYAADKDRVIKLTVKVSKSGK